MDDRGNRQEMDNKEKYYEHLSYPNLGNEGMSPLIKEYNSMLPQYQNIYLYGTPGHFGAEHQYNSQIHSDNPFIHERIAPYNYRPYYNGYYNYYPYQWPYYHHLYFSFPVFFPLFVLSQLFSRNMWY